MATESMKCWWEDIAYPDAGAVLSTGRKKA
uniref:Uncharacterized protein n=1 Tax=Anguilla anguilla TaxID=7936 RepID=A0A0E9RLE3_ANGAN